MRYQDILDYLIEGYQDDVNDTLSDVLMNLKIQGLPGVKTSQISDEFRSKGMNISTTALLDMLAQNPMISDANEEEVTFATDTPSVDTTNPEKDQENDQATVNSMATQALNKRM